jgi:thioredoxin reductase (NADPH)
MDEVYDVVIIGSGPAGLTAGVYSSRAALKTVLLAGAKWGGQLMLTTEVENFPGFPEGIQGPELMERMRKQAERFGVKIIDENMTDFDFSSQPFKVMYGSNTLVGHSVIIATGAETRWLGLPNEQNLIGRGVSSCAPCDAPFFRNKRVMVVGGGDAAMEEAMVLTKFASEVILVHRRDEFRASKIMLDRVLTHPKVRVIKSSEVVDILGKEKVSGVKVKNLTDGSEQTLEIDGIFVAIGHIPACKIFGKQVELDEKGYIVSRRHGAFKKQEEDGTERIHDYHTMTSVDGVFVAGDVHDYHYRQAITASGYGCEAALEAERWLAQNK